MNYWSLNLNKTSFVSISYANHLVKEEFLNIEIVLLESP